MRPTIKGYAEKYGSSSLYPHFSLDDTVRDHTNHDFKWVACQNRRVKVHDIEFLVIDLVEGRLITWGIWYPIAFTEHSVPDWIREIRT